MSAGSFIVVFLVYLVDCIWCPGVSDCFGNVERTGEAFGDGNDRLFLALSNKNEELVT